MLWFWRWSWRRTESQFCHGKGEVWRILSRDYNRRRLIYNVFDKKIADDQYRGLFESLEDYLVSFVSKDWPDPLWICPERLQEFLALADCLVGTNHLNTWQLNRFQACYNLQTALTFFAKETSVMSVSTTNNQSATYRDTCTKCTDLRKQVSSLSSELECVKAKKPRVKYKFWWRGKENSSDQGTKQIWLTINAVTLIFASANYIFGAGQLLYCLFFWPLLPTVFALHALKLVKVTVWEQHQQ